MRVPLTVGQTQDARQGLGQRHLAYIGQVFDERMTPRQQVRQRQPYVVLLALQKPPDLATAFSATSGISPPAQVRLARLRTVV